MVHVSVGSPAGAEIVGTPSFLRYVLRLGEADLTIAPAERAALEMLAAIPHAFGDEDMCSGAGWRIVPATSLEDWPVLEATPQRLRSAFETARRILWMNAAPMGISANDVIDVDGEIDKVMGVLFRAEAAGFSVNVTYVA